jgi:hypothetical protein
MSDTDSETDEYSLCTGEMPSKSILIPMQFHSLLPLPLVSLLLQHFSFKTRNTCLSFFSGIALHSKVLRTE